MKKHCVLRMNSVYKRLASLFLVCSLIPLFAMACIAYVNFYHEAKENTIAMFEAAGEQTMIAVRNRMEQIETLSNTITLYMYRLSTTPTDPLLPYLDNYSSAKTGIDSNTSSFKALETTVFLPEDRLLSSGGNRIDILPLDALPDYNCTQKDLLAQEDISFWRFTKGQIFANAFSSKPYDVLTFWSVSRDLKQQHINYAYAIHLSTEEFSSMLQSNELLGKNSRILMADGTVIAATDAQSIGEKMDVSFYDAEADDLQVQQSDGVLRVLHSTDALPMILYTEIPLSYIISQSSRPAQYILGMALAMFAVTILCSLLASKGFTRRIDRLSETIERTQATSDRSALDGLAEMRAKPAEKKDEIDRLADTYSTMLLQNDRMQEERIQMIQHEEKLKYQLLQAEINPHFLFNALNVISVCIAAGEISSAQEMISDLSQFYKLILRTVQDEITIRQEMHMTDLYLRMMKLSVHSPLTWSIRMEDGVENFMIRKFVFQPLVENAVVHGVACNDQALHIEITGEYTDSGVIFRVSDNGIGIPWDKLVQLREALARDKIETKQHYGLVNVNHRLKPYYLEQTDMQIDSEVGRGTSLCFCIQQIYATDEKGPTEDEKCIYR
ncbi:MAG TPA: histidine kinase [Candidatus Pullichristensenella excrementipullorum]|nr:histidine kinase [Candidatus Pullichristensenella excrementipullorum]